MAIEDKIVGGSMLIAASVIFSYYTVWTLFLPFLDSDHPLQATFPDRTWAVRIPAVLLIILLSACGAFVGLVMVKSAKRRALTGIKRGA